MRVVLNGSELIDLVRNQCNENVQNGTTFTAYNVTHDLRNANPGINIPHDAVRPVVHDTLSGHLQAGTYTRHTRHDLMGNPWEYAPTAMSALPVLPVPTLAAPDTTDDTAPMLADGSALPTLRLPD